MLFACFPCTFRTQDPLLQQVWSRVNPDTGYLKSSKQGAATARDGNFAFICEEPFGDYLATLPPCNLRTIQSFLITDNARTYNFAAQKREDLKENITAINKVIERMSNNNELQNLYDKSFKGGDCARMRVFPFSFPSSILLAFCTFKNIVIGSFAHNCKTFNNNSFDKFCVFKIQFEIFVEFLVYKSSHICLCNRYIDQPFSIFHSIKIFKIVARLFRVLDGLRNISSANIKPDELMMTILTSKNPKWGLIYLPVAAAFNNTIAFNIYVFFCCILSCQLRIILTSKQYFWIQVLVLCDKMKDIL